MSDTQIAIVSFVVFVVLIAIGGSLAIVLAVRNSKYKSFVALNSVALKNLKGLNSKTQFYTFQTNYSLYHRFDNKSSYTKTQCSDFLIRDVRTDYLLWHELSKRIQSSLVRMN